MQYEKYFSSSYIFVYLFHEPSGEWNNNKNIRTRKIFPYCTNDIVITGLSLARKIINSFEGKTVHSSILETLFIQCLCFFNASFFIFSICIYNLDFKTFDNLLFFQPMKSHPVFYNPIKLFLYIFVTVQWFFNTLCRMYVEM